MLEAPNAPNMQILSAYQMTVLKYCLGGRNGPIGILGPCYARTEQKPP
jgi:hypothetical protein